MSLQQIKLLHYRNGAYQGQVKSNKRHGYGILITDQSQIIIGNWKNDKLYGKAVFFPNCLEFAYGQFNRGQLQGWFKFESADRVLVAEFNFDQPINKQLLIRKDQSLCKLIVKKNPIYEILREINLQNNTSYTQVIQQQLGVKLPYPNLHQILQQEYKSNPNFHLETLPNGYNIFKFNDPQIPISLGFVYNKSYQLVSFGSYINNKLSGYGCKFQNTNRYEGVFDNGFLNGEGLKFSAGKYSYGLFENGTLVDPVFLEERSLASEERLKELKRLYHLKHMNFSNTYLKGNVIKFKGLSQIVFQVSLKQDYIFRQLMDSTISPSKKQNNLATKLLGFQREETAVETKSNFSSIRKNKNPQEDDFRSISRVSEAGRNISGSSSRRLFKA